MAVHEHESRLLSKVAIEIKKMLRRTVILLDRFHWLWLAMAAPFLVFPSPQRSLAMLVVPVLFLLRWLALLPINQKIPGDPKSSGPNQWTIIPITPLNGVLLLMFLMVLVSLWATYDINLSLPKISGMILGIGLFVAISREGQYPRGWWLSFFVFLAIGFGISVIGLLGTNWITKISFLNPILSRLGTRITGLPGVEEGFNQNTVAGVLLWMIPSYWTFTWLLLRMKRDLRILLGRGKTLAGTIILFAATLWLMLILVLTQSREGYIGLALTMPVLILIALSSKWRKYGLVFLAILAVIIGILIIINWESVRIWFAGEYLTTNTAFSLDSLRGRLEVWSGAINGIRDFPYTGMGMNTFRKVVLVLYPHSNFLLDVGHSHNEFLQAGLDLGIPGLVSFVSLYIIAFWMLIRIWRRAQFTAQSDPTN